MGFFFCFRLGYVYWHLENRSCTGGCLEEDLDVGWGLDRVQLGLLTVWDDWHLEHGGARVCKRHEEPLDGLVFVLISHLALRIHTAFDLLREVNSILTFNLLLKVNTNVVLWLIPQTTVAHQVEHLLTFIHLLLSLFEDLGLKLLLSSVELLSTDLLLVLRWATIVSIKHGLLLIEFVHQVTIWIGLTALLWLLLPRSFFRWLFTT